MNVGDKVKTRGGWEAVVIWIPYNVMNGGFFVVHKPGEEHESVPVYHDCFGKAYPYFAVNEPPSYGLHPSDIIL